MICVICLLGVLASAMSLGSLRLYGLYLEHRLAYVTGKIEAVGNRNASLEERYSALLSPSRIYHYAKSELNMVTAKEIETITLQENPEQGVTLAEAGAEEGVGIKGPRGLAHLFTGIANAKD